MLLDNQSGSNEAEILGRIQASRQSAEPIEPTEEVEAQEVAPEEVQAEVEESTEIELEAEESEQDESQTDESGELYVDIGGREISFSQIKEWEQGSLRQDDYTRKSMANADERKSLESQKASLEAKSKRLDESIAALEALTSDFEQTEVDGMSLEELRDVDPGQYLKVTEENKRKRDALKKAKSNRSTLSDEDLQAKQTQELSKLVQNNPHWVKDGKETKAYQEDMTLVNSYLDGQGYSEDDKKGILNNGYGQVFIDAARYHAGKKASASLAKKVRKAPVVTKPGGASKSVATTNLDKAKANHKKYGTVETAMALRKAQKQFKGE